MTQCNQFPNQGPETPANFHEIVEDAEDIQQFANRNWFVSSYIRTLESLALSEQ